MYVHPNFKTKKALKEAVANGDRVEIFSPGLYPAPQNGVASVEGPHAPESHTWYGQVEIENGVVYKVL